MGDRIGPKYSISDVRQGFQERGDARVWSRAALSHFRWPRSANRSEQAEQEEDIRHIDDAVRIDIRNTAFAVAPESTEQQQDIGHPDHLVPIQIPRASHCTRSRHRAPR